MQNENDMKSDILRLENEVRIQREKLDLLNQKLRDKERQFNELSAIHNNMCHSVSYRLGRGLTWFPRKTRAVLKCLKQHGCKYTGSIFLKKVIETVFPDRFVVLNRVFRENVLEGYKVYEGLIIKYGKNVKALNDSFFTSDRKIYFMDYGGAGDIYLCCSYLSSKGQITDRDILIAPSKTVQKVASYFGFGCIVEISKRESFSLRIMDRFSGTKLWVLPLLYESIPLIYSGILRHMQGHRGIDFMSMLRIGMEINFGLVDSGISEVAYELPYEQVELNDMFKKYKLEQKPVALLSPYMGSHEKVVTMSFWEKIARHLFEKGYVVFTNTFDIREEPPIYDTLPICLPYHLVVPFISNGGVFLGLRSGLCDIIATAKDCKKIILYPNRRTREGVSSWKKFFSLSDMGLCNDAIEIEYDKYRAQEILAQIIDVLNR